MVSSFPDPRGAGETFTALAERGWWPGGPTDPNPTKNGVTQKAYDEARGKAGLPTQSVTLMTAQEQGEIYDSYWVECWGSLVAKISGALAVCHFDAAFNAGAPRAAKFLQRTAGQPEPVTGILDQETLDDVQRICLVSEDGSVAAYLQNRWDFLQDLDNFAAWQRNWARRENRLAQLCGVTWRVPGLETLT